jgi:hypothetical protein
MRDNGKQIPHCRGERAMHFKKIRFAHLGVFIVILFTLLLPTNVFTVEKLGKHENHRELKAFEKFLGDHPSIAADLYKDPAR